MQQADSVYFLAGFTGEYRHTETFSFVSRIMASEIHQVIPGYAQFVGIPFHVFVEKSLVKIIMAGGYRCMYGIKRRSAY